MFFYIFVYSILEKMWLSVEEGVKKEKKISGSNLEGLD